MSIENWGIIATILSAFATILIANLNFSNEKNTKKERILKLYEEYHRPEFYGKIRAPFYEIYIKWSLSDEYKQVVVKGWANDSEDCNLLLETTPICSKDPCEIQCSPEYYEHFLQSFEVNTLTEHQILTIGLRFWSTLYMLYSEKLIDRKLIQIFSESYGYDRDFIADLRIHLLVQLIRDKCYDDKGESAENFDKIKLEGKGIEVSHHLEPLVENLLPSWYWNTKKLEDVFNKLTVKAIKKKKRNPQNLFRGFR